MLESCNVQVSRENGAVTVVGGSRPSPFTLQVPGDPSSAAFLQAAAALTGGCVTVRDVSANETRTGFLRVLEQMGVRVAMSNPRTWMGEPVADTTVSGAPSRPIHVTEPDIPALIDEIPVIALLLTQVPGTSVIRGAAELRLKETDRIDTVARSLKAMGAEVEEHPDGMTIHGPTPLRGAEVESYGDHRLGMMLAVAGACAEGETVLTGAEAAAVSFPAFPDTYRQVGGRLDVS
jgi:3-phosphoshikimate 1-carboxyvinyltransferase